MPGPESLYTPEFVEPFLERLREGATEGKACAVIGVSRQWVYKQRREHPEFNQACIEAIEDGVDLLEEEARRRAVQGVATPVFNSKGELVDHKIEYSDALLTLLIKGRRPQVFRDRMSTEVTGPGGMPLNEPSSAMERLLSVVESVVNAQTRKDEREQKGE